MFSTAPSTLPPTLLRLSTARVARPRRHDPASTTSSTPSTWLDSTVASVTARAGGLSNSTTSACPLRCSINRVMLPDPSSSEGLGGSGPVVSTRRFSTSVGWM